ncbi:hypothetical protein SmaMPs15_000087 [Stenotrophomonas maltophilia phage vB_SmaM_Ps15]|uniref:Uncharacterized protein n=1 Tax=Stenotrophomonas maltophilia phage vB_SmaM_Ps15 TaxID=3071007 RepID=A0AAE9JU87_9CAUD|nr:hypothetical protein PQC01_gp087 [Stenotrophomonas maltophilia phage vB_SmaM_Ps15]UMO77238.1 hypothetical protein SmaMPs15_000087 [Stenotrophomonas maltophilia phage vB_SmaM_Ps15]
MSKSKFVILSSDGHSITTIHDKLPKNWGPTDVLEVVRKHMAHDDDTSLSWTHAGLEGNGKMMFGFIKMWRQQDDVMLSLFLYL